MRKVVPLKDRDCPQKHPVSLQSSFVVLVSSCWEPLLSHLAQHLWSQWQWLLRLLQLYSGYSGLLQWYFCFLSFLSVLSLFLHLALEFAEKCWQDLRQEKWCALGAASALPQASQLLLPLFPLFPQSQRSQSSVSQNANFHSLKPELQASLAASCRVQTRKCKRCCSFWRKQAKKQKRTERARPKANRECKRSVNKQMITDGLCDFILRKPWNQYQCFAECNNPCLNRELVGTGQNFHVHSCPFMLGSSEKFGPVRQMFFGCWESHHAESFCWPLVGPFGCSLLDLKRGLKPGRMMSNDVSMSRWEMSNRKLWRLHVLCFPCCPFHLSLSSSIVYSEPHSFVKLCIFPMCRSFSVWISAMPSIIFPRPTGI